MTRVSEVLLRKAAEYFVGDTPQAHAIREQLVHAALYGRSVIIFGETGVGKDLCASAIQAVAALHTGTSPRLEALNCSSLSPTLAESELFGHMKGTFTGATVDRKGAFQNAHGGFVFLDEIGELPLDLQPKLLRALEGRVRPVGGTEADVNVRVIAATNRDLKAMVRAGRFREDLYYRLAVTRIDIPPLRDRLPDVAALAQRFLTAVWTDLGGAGSLELTNDAKLRLCEHEWPGNGRELRTIMLRLASRVIGGDPRAIDRHDVESVLAFEATDTGGPTWDRADAWARDALAHPLPTFLVDQLVGRVIRDRDEHAGLSMPGRLDAAQLQLSKEIDQVLASDDGKQRINATMNKNELWNLFDVGQSAQNNAVSSFVRRRGDQRPREPLSTDRYYPHHLARIEAILSTGAYAVIDTIARRGERVAIEIPRLRAANVTRLIARVLIYDPAKLSDAIAQAPEKLDDLPAVCAQRDTRLWIRSYSAEPGRPLDFPCLHGNAIAAFTGNPDELWDQTPEKLRYEHLYYGFALLDENPGDKYFYAQPDERPDVRSLYQVFKQWFGRTWRVMAPGGAPQHVEWPRVKTVKPE